MSAPNSFSTVIFGIVLSESASSPAWAVIVIAPVPPRSAVVVHDRLPVLAPWLNVAANEFSASIRCSTVHLNASVAMSYDGSTAQSSLCWYRAETARFLRFGAPKSSRSYVTVARVLSSTSNAQATVFELQAPETSFGAFFFSECRYLMSTVRSAMTAAVEKENRGVSLATE